MYESDYISLRLLFSLVSSRVSANLSLIYAKRKSNRYKLRKPITLKFYTREIVGYRHDIHLRCTSCNLFHVNNLFRRLLWICAIVDKRIIYLLKQSMCRGNNSIYLFNQLILFIGFIHIFYLYLHRVMLTIVPK